MSSRLYTYLQGASVTAAATLQLLPSGSTGTRGALRRLVHPDSANFSPLVYYRNPDRQGNFDTDVLRTPIVSVIRTAAASRTLRFEEIESDVLVREQWLPEGGLSMPDFMFRQLYEYYVNVPDFSATNQEYITWEPRDETTSSWKVQIIDLNVGGNTLGTYNIRKYIAAGGPSDPLDPGPLFTPTDGLDVSPGAPILDAPVTLTMRIIEEV